MLRRNFTTLHRHLPQSFYRCPQYTLRYSHWRVATSFSSMPVTTTWVAGCWPWIAWSWSVDFSHALICNSEDCDHSPNLPLYSSSQSRHPIAVDLYIQVTEISILIWVLLDRPLICCYAPRIYCYPPVVLQICWMDTSSLWYERQFTEAKGNYLDEWNQEWGGSLS